MVNARFLEHFPVSARFVPCTTGQKVMYKTQDYGYKQLSFTNFNTTGGRRLDHKMNG